MASVDVSKLSSQELAELACTYSALILYDDGQQITADKMSKLINASGVKIQSYWPGIFAKAIEGQNISSFFNFGGAASSAPVVAATSTPAPAAEKKVEKKQGKKKQEPKKQEPKEEEEDAGMGGLFD